MTANLLGTAGAPMLNIITSKGLSNVLVVVTRYFGGILLGTGGLVRAYSEALEKSIEEAEILNKDLGIEAELEVSYSDLQKLKYYLEKNNIKIINNEFNENVKVIFEITKSDFEKILLEKNNLNFEIINSQILKDKYIDVN
jgi:putative IMPACT (imprinted ancient) family translation regulator